MKTDNELIAEFIGDCPKNYDFETWCLNADYNTSWDWIMPVVERINEYGIWTIRPGFAMFENYNGELRNTHLFKFIKSTQDFEEVNGEPVEWCFIVACVCIDFIKWYNTKKTN